jgi:hydrogenase maturation protease
VAALCVRGIDLLEAWAGADAVLLVDTVRSPDPAGTLHRFDASETALPAAGARSARGSTHAVGVGEAIELARTLGRLPAAVIVHGVTGERFELGAPLSAAVQEALPALAAAVRRDYDALGRR